MYLKKLTSNEYEKIKEHRNSRNKLALGSPIELMIALGIEPIGRKIDPITRKPNILSEDELVEGSKSIERNQGLRTFIQQLTELIMVPIIGSMLVRYSFGSIFVSKMQMIGIVSKLSFVLSS